MYEYNGVKIFSATKAGDRNSLGEEITNWIKTHPTKQVVDTVVKQSSDQQFHCLTIILFYNENN